METFRIIDIIPGRAAESTLTPGRRFLQVVFVPVEEEGFLVTERKASRNFFEEWLGGKTPEGGTLNIAADQLFVSICEACHINRKEAKWVKDEFTAAVGMKVKGDLVNNYVRPYKIPGSLSKNSLRVQYTALVLKGENEFSIFRNQGHPIITDPKELMEVKILASKIAEENAVARELRQKSRGVPTPGERVGTGEVIKDRTYKDEERGA